MQESLRYLFVLMLFYFFILHTSGILLSLYPTSKSNQSCFQVEHKWTAVNDQTKRNFRSCFSFLKVKISVHRSSYECWWENAGEMFIQLLFNHCRAASQVGGATFLEHWNISNLFALFHFFKWPTKVFPVGLDQVSRCQMVLLCLIFSLSSFLLHFFFI